MLVVDNIW